MRKLEEPLEQSAPIAWRLAPGLCRRDPRTGESCAWIHRIWQYLRIAGLASTPQNHLEFLTNAFQTVDGRNSAPRILISGAADYAMLASTLESFRLREVAPEVTVVDICETPLMLNRWYAERVSCNLDAVCSDVLEYEDATPFDAICTHSFFSELPPGRRPRVLARWRDLLRPGGRVITVNRIRPAAGPDAVGFSPDQVKEFRAKVFRRARSLQESIQVDPDELAREAEIYAMRRKAYPLRTREEILDLFECSGFRLEEVSFTRPAAESRPAVAGPSAPGGAEYARIMATRV